MGVPKDLLPKKLSSRLLAFSKLKDLPMWRFAELAEALKAGASIKQAARCASLTPDELDMLLYWGAQNVEPWVELYEMVLRECGKPQVMMQSARFHAGLGGDARQMTKWQQGCDKDIADMMHFYNETTGKGGAGLSVGGDVNVMVQKTFPIGEAVEKLPPGEEGKIIDAEYEEN